MLRDRGCYAPCMVDFKGRPFDVLSDLSEKILYVIVLLVLESEGHHLKL